MATSTQRWHSLRRLSLLLGAALAVLCGCRAAHEAASPALSSIACRTATSQFENPATHRRIPVRTYAPAGGQVAGFKVALLNHGYGIKNSAYSFLARNLVAHGYFVVSVQQVLPTDAPLPTTGNPAEARRPAWEQGVQSLRAVLQALPRRYPGLDCTHTVLVGHSYGGDICMLFAQKYPLEVQQVISLDNCRMPLPRQPQPRVLALRSSDQQPDPGVLPTPAEQAALGTRIVQLPATRHGDLCDRATKAQQQEINRYITEFLAQ